MEDRSKRTETVRPQLDERCGEQRECDSVWSATNDENEEVNGETDDEDIEDGETEFDDGSAQVTTIRDPGHPTVKEYQEHMTTHRPYRSWCKGRGVNAPHRRSDAQDDLEGVPHVSMDYGFLGERESEEQVSPVLIIRERRHKMTWTMLVPTKGTGSLGSRREQRGSLISSVTTGSPSGGTMSQRLKRWQGKSAKHA